MASSAWSAPGSFLGPSFGSDFLFKRVYDWEQVPVLGLRLSEQICHYSQSQTLLKPGPLCALDR